MWPKLNVEGEDMRLLQDAAEGARIDRRDGGAKYMQLGI